MSGVAAERQLLSAAQKHINDGDEKGCRDLLQSAVDAPAFSQLTPDTQHNVYYILGVTAYDLGDSKTGLIYAKKAIAMDQATGADWKLASIAAYLQKDTLTEADTLIVIARRWPALLDQYRDTYYLALCRRLISANENKRRTDLLNSLEKANWRPTDHLQDWSIIWFWLAQIRLEAGDLNGARAAAEKIKSDYLALEMQADKRFDSIIAAYPERFDPVSAAKRKLAELQAASKAEPKRLEGVYLTALQLMTLKRNGDALVLVDAALKAAIPKSGIDSPYSDVDDYLIWVMDTRSHLLRRVGRYDDAVAQERAVAQYAEKGKLNVSQLLNLGILLVDLGRAKEALDTVKDAELRNMSPFGRMTLMQVRTCANLQLHDTKSAGEALAYMRAHKADGRGPLKHGLLCADDQAGLADLVVQTLADPNSRIDELVDLQNLDPPAGETAQELSMRARMEAVKMRPEVQDAISAVGRIKRYPINAPLD